MNYVTGFAEVLTDIGRRVRLGILGAFAWRWLPYCLLALCGSAPLLWLRHGYPIKSVDSFLSVHPSGLPWRSLQAWDARDSTGAPMSDVVSWSMTGVQVALGHLNVPLVAIDAVILTTLALSAVLGMFFLSDMTLRGYIGQPGRRWIASLVSVAWVANPFALSFVWYHQLLTEVTWASWPWVIYVVLAIGHADSIACEVADRRKALFLLPLLVAIMTIFSAGFVHVYLPALGGLLLAFGSGAFLSSPLKLATLRKLALLSITVLASILWWLLPSIPLLPSLLRTASIGPDSRSQFLFASGYSQLPEVVALTAVPALHQSVAGVPYMSWSGLILNPPGSLLRFVLPATAACGVVAVFRVRSVRWFGAPAAAAVLAGALLSKGFNWPLPGLSLALTQIPFGDAFRHPVDKFATLLVLPLCLLFGVGLASLSRIHGTVLTIFSGIVVCGYLALPWWTGAVVPTGGEFLPSAFIQIPQSYESIGSQLATSPIGGKTMVIPYSLDGEAAFNWPQGVQPNLDCLLQDWSPNRSLLCHSTGQPLADIVPSTLAQAVSRRDRRAFELARLSGVDRWLVHGDWDSAYLRTNPSPQAALAFLGNPASRTPGPMLLRRTTRLDLPPPGQSLSFFFRSTAVPSIDDKLLSIGPLTLQINRAVGSDSLVYVGVYDSASGEWTVSASIPIGGWHQISLRQSGSTFALYVDGVASQEVFTCFPCKLVSRHYIVVTPLPNFVEVLPSRQLPAVTEMTGLVADDLAFERLDQGTPIRIASSTPELTLFEQPALPLVYAAHSVYGVSAPADLLSAAAAVGAQPWPVLLPSDVSPSSLDTRARLAWRLDSAVRLHGTLNLHGTSVLVFSQTFDRHWRLALKGGAAAQEGHVVANGFANAWIIRGEGATSWTLDYDLEPATLTGGLIGGALLVSSIGALSWLAADHYIYRRRRSAGVEVDQ